MQTLSDHDFKNANKFLFFVERTFGSWMRDFLDTSTRRRKKNRKSFFLVLSFEFASVSFFPRCRQVQAKSISAIAKGPEPKRLQ
jgi:hypothetical protein